MLHHSFLYVRAHLLPFMHSTKYANISYVPSTTVFEVEDKHGGGEANSPVREADLRTSMEDTD